MTEKSPNPPVLKAYSTPPATLPPGHGYLHVEFNHGPQPRPVPFWLVRGRLRLVVGRMPVDLVGQALRGDWYVPVPAGEHLVRVVDRYGVTLASTWLTVSAVGTPQRYFHFGAIRNQVYDRDGKNVTKFGMLSVWAMLVLIFPCLAGQTGLVTLLNKVLDGSAAVIAYVVLVGAVLVLFSVGLPVAAVVSRRRARAPAPRRR